VRLLGIVVLAAAFSLGFLGAPHQGSASGRSYAPGVVRAIVTSKSKVEALTPIKLPDGSTFTPYVAWITVTVNRSDLLAERDRALADASRVLAASTATTEVAGARARLAAIRSDFDKALSTASSDKCGFYIIQRLPDAAFGRASPSSICTESDPVDTLMWGYSGQVFEGLQAAGWGSDYCGPYTQPTQYLWLDDSGAYGFYQNYSGWSSGSCTGTRNHVRLWDLYDGYYGLAFSVGTAHRETWSWSDLTHHVVSNGWHLGRDALYSAHPAAGGYYYLGNWGWWGSGGYYDGNSAEMGCYSIFGC
jgi:hypothetical protein